MHVTDWMQRVDLGEEIQEVYLHSFLFKLAVKLVSIFIPLYILSLGHSVSMVIMFFIAYYTTFIISSWPNAKISSRLGYKHTSLLSSPLILLFYLLLRSNPSEMALFPVAVLGGLGFNLYWAGMNPEVAESSHSENREKETGFFFSMPTLASMLSPVIGGLILASYGFQILFLFAAISIATSFLPFLFSQEHHEGMDMNPRAFISLTHLNDFITYTMKGFHGMGKKVIWPLYLAIVIENSVSIGSAGSMLALGGAIMSIALGKITNDNNRNRIILSGAAVTAVSYLLMSQVINTEAAVLVSFLNGLGRTAISLPIYSRAMQKAEEEDYLEYFAFREIGLSLGRVLILGAILAIFTFTPYRFTAAFIMVASSLIAVGYFGRKI